MRRACGWLGFYTRVSEFAMRAIVNGPWISCYKCAHAHKVGGFGGTRFATHTNAMDSLCCHAPNIFNPTNKYINIRTREVSEVHDLTNKYHRIISFFPTLSSDSVIIESLSLVE